MKQKNFESVRYRITLTYKDGSIEVVTISAADDAVVMMVARGWLLSSALGSFVRYCPIDRDGRQIGVGGQYTL